VTSVVKHTFNDHVVLQYIVKNTLNDQVLEKVSVTLEFDNDELDAEQIVPIKRLIYNQPESCFISLRKQPKTYPIGIYLFLFFSIVFLT
jgi:coatomer protein complex subunit gamma